MCRVDYADEEGAWIREPHHEAEMDETFTCCECHRPIEPLESFVAFEWAWESDEDGEPVLETTAGVHRFCAQCEAAGVWLNKVCNGHLYGSEQIVEELREHWDEEPPPIRSLDLGRLIVGQRRKWRRRDGSLIPAPVVKAWATAGAERALAPIGRDTDA